MANEAISAALQSAHRQLLDLQAGNVDAFLENVEKHVRLCLDVSQSTASPEDEPQLRELLAINATISTTLASLTLTVKHQLARAHSGSRLPAAYMVAASA